MEIPDFGSRYQGQVLGKRGSKVRGSGFKRWTFLTIFAVQGIHDIGDFPLFETAED